MPERLKRAKQLRMNAEHLRAGLNFHAEDKELFLAVAHDYEDFADALERSAKADGIERMETG